MSGDPVDDCVHPKKQVLGGCKEEGPKALERCCQLVMHSFFKPLSHITKVLPKRTWRRRGGHDSCVPMEYEEACQKMRHIWASFGRALLRSC
eukprot:1154661-Pelagomonas_calceolata.AAC.10